MINTYQNRKTTRLIAASALGLIGALPVVAFGQAMPGMAMPPASAAKPFAVSAKAKSQTSVAMSGMTSSIDLNDPMSQEASGTAWLPASSPMYGKMFMGKNGDMLMLHGAVMPRYTYIGSKRGDRRFDAPNWFMGMYGHQIDSKSQLGLRTMLSLDPITEGGNGYPLLYQTGESWHHQPLHDRQHPHDLVDELAVSYSRLLGNGKSAYAYFGYPGEPALGPPTYMHRLLAYDLADAPIGHHWQDATHITFGVATLGLNVNSKLKLEVSDFTGREPDENRYSFDKPRFDSNSGRLSYNPDANNALQASYGYIKNAEGDGANQHRITASWLYNKPLGDDSNFTTALVFGQNNLTTEGRSNSYLAEADYQRGSDTVFTRVENIQKSGHELVLPEAGLLNRKFTLGAYTVGYMRDLTHGRGIDTGLGFAVTADTHPAALNTDYGTGTPLSFQVYLRLRPSRMKAMNMSGMDMTDTAPPTADAAPSMPTVTGQPAMAPQSPQTASPVSVPAPAAPPVRETPADMLPVTISRIDASISPGTPKARTANTLTLTVTGSDGKPFTGATVSASVAMTSMDMGTGHPAFTEIGDGKYQGHVSFAMGGPWRVVVKVTSPGGGKTVTKILSYSVGR